jgi:hypothetical protein
MRKLRLDLEALQIETFVTETGSAGRGTVRGQSFLVPSHYTVCPYLCIGGEGDPTQGEETCVEAKCGPWEM